MLTDPIVVPSGFPAAGNFAAVSREPNKSVYKLTSGGKVYTFTISNQLNKPRTRTSIRLDVADVVADPLIPANSRTRSIAAYIVLDREQSVSSTADTVDVLKQLLGLFSIATAANITTTVATRVADGES